MKKVLLLVTLALGFNSYSQFSIHINNTYSVEGVVLNPKYDLEFSRGDLFSSGFDLEYHGFQSGYSNSLNFSFSLIKEIRDGQFYNYSTNSFERYQFYTLGDRSEIYWRHYFGVESPLSGFTTSIGVGLSAVKRSFGHKWSSEEDIEFTSKLFIPHAVLGLGYSYNLPKGFILGGDFRTSVWNAHSFDFGPSKYQKAFWRYSLTLKVGYRFNSKNIKNSTQSVHELRKKNRERKESNKIKNDSKFQKIKL